MNHLDHDSLITLAASLGPEGEGTLHHLAECATCTRELHHLLRISAVLNPSVPIETATLEQLADRLLDAETHAVGDASVLEPSGQSVFKRADRILAQWVTPLLAAGCTAMAAVLGTVAQPPSLPWLLGAPIVAAAWMARRAKLDA